MLFTNKSTSGCDQTQRRQESQHVRITGSAGNDLSFKQRSMNLCRLLFESQSQQKSLAANFDNSRQRRERLSQVCFDRLSHSLACRRCSIASSVAVTAAIAIMPPPNVVPRSFSFMCEAMRSLTRQAPTGIPLPSDFRQSNDVWNDTRGCSLTTGKKPFPRSAHTSLHFVEDQNDAALVAQLAQGQQKIQVRQSSLRPSTELARA